MLHENSLTQIIREPTHIHGNTLDLLCVNDTSIVCSTEVITPGLSDHSIITAEVKYGSFAHQDEHILIGVRSVSTARQTILNSEN